MKKLFLIIVSVIVMNPFCFAQQPDIKNKTALDISARSYSDHIVLRFSPFTPILFNQGNKVGYIIERANFINGLPFEKLTYTAIKGSPLQRWNEEQWKKALNEEIVKDSSATNLIAMAMGYSDPGVSTPGGDVLKDGLQSLREQRNNADMRYGFSLIAANRNQKAAEGLALCITDLSVTLGQTYVYRVLLNQPVNNPLTDIAYVKVTCEDFNDKYLRNDKVVKLMEGDGNITFSFPESVNYYAFIAERSDDNGISYKKIIKTPILSFTPSGYDSVSEFAYRDTNLTDYRKYHYRILVSTIFADELVLSEFTAIPRDRTPPPSPFLKSANHVKPKQVELRWEMPKKNISDLKGFKISRGSFENGKYDLISKGILPATTLSYIDESFDKDGPNYYMVEAVDTAGNSSYSYPAYVTLIDSIPPAIPVISSARIDSVGKITIKVKPNIEKDFMGYQLLKANAKDHDFSVVLETFKDSLGRTTFTMYDSATLNTLTKNIYYKVIAFDTHFNQSEPSKVIELKKRDTIPPVSPLITGCAINDTSVVISFANSSSEDAVLNILLRRESGKAKFDTVFSNTNIRVTRFIDKNIIGGRQYEYAMIAKDDGGLSSKISNSIQIKTLLNNRIPAPKLEGTYDSNTKKVSLNFIVDAKLVNRKLKIEIFKRDNKLSGWNIFKTIDFEKGKPFLDDAADGQSGSNYTVRLTDETQKSSNFSNALELKFK